MPSYKVHIMGGAVTYLLVYKLSEAFSLLPQFPPMYQMLFLGITLLGSIFPDIDIKSKMQRLFFISALITLPLLLYFGQIDLFIYAGLLCILPIILRHRTITHRAWFLICAPASCAIILSAHNQSLSSIIFSSCTYFSMGALSHIVLDFGPRRIFSRK